jgi:hypothetical protein
MVEQVMGSVDSHPGVWAVAALVSVLLLPTDRTAIGVVASLVVLLLSYFAKGVAGSVLFFLMATVGALALAILPSLYFGAEVNRGKRGPISAEMGGWIVVACILLAAALEALSVWHVYQSVGSYLPF